MEALFIQLYPFVFIIGMAGYGPQLYKLFRDRKSADGLSLSTWMIWTSTWAISLGYGMVHLDDLMFCMVAGMNLVAHMAVIAFILLRKWEVARENTLPSDNMALAYVPVRKNRLR